MALIAVENRCRGGGEGRGDYAEIEPWAPDLNHFYWSTLTIKRKEGEDYEEIEPWAPNLNHFYWSTLTIGGGIRTAEARDWLPFNAARTAGSGGGGVSKQF